MKNLIYKNITSLLQNRNWHKGEIKTKHDVFIPPKELGFSETYKLYVYNQVRNADFEEGINKTLQIISQIYNEDVDELISLIIEDRPILQFHIEDDNIKNGRPDIVFFENFITKTKDLLLESANFSINRKPHYLDKEDESERYLSLCNFFKIDKGSLITKIQLPNKEEILEKTIFDEGLTGNKINQQFIDITTFINEKVISQNNFEPTEELITQNRNLISANITEKLRNLYICANYADVDITLKSVENTFMTKVSELNNEKIENLKKFSTFIKQQNRDIFDYEMSGKIVELKSNDVESDKNSIKIVGKLKNASESVVVQLKSNEIKIAADAFKNNKTISIGGIFEKEKTQYRILELHKFEIRK